MSRRFPQLSGAVLRAASRWLVPALREILHRLEAFHPSTHDAIDSLTPKQPESTPPKPRQSTPAQSRTASGPPAHWLEKVRRGAPHLLQALEQLTTPLPCAMETIPGTASRKPIVQKAGAPAKTMQLRASVEDTEDWNPHPREASEPVPLPPLRQSPVRAPRLHPASRAAIVGTPKSAPTVTAASYRTLPAGSVSHRIARASETPANAVLSDATPDPLEAAGSPPSLKSPVETTAFPVQSGFAAAPQAESPSPPSPSCDRLLLEPEAGFNRSGQGLKTTSGGEVSLSSRAAASDWMLAEASVEGSAPQAPFNFPCPPSAPAQPLPKIDSPGWEQSSRREPGARLQVSAKGPVPDSSDSLAAGLSRSLPLRCDRWPSLPGTAAPDTCDEISSARGEQERLRYLALEQEGIYGSRRISHRG